MEDYYLYEIMYQKRLHHQYHQLTDIYKHDSSKRETIERTKFSYLYFLIFFFITFGLSQVVNPMFHIRSESDCSFDKP